MTIVSNSVIFNSPAPDMEAVISAVENLSGLKVIVEISQVEDDIHEMNQISIPGNIHGRYKDGNDFLNVCFESRAVVS